MRRICFFLKRCGLKCAYCNKYLYNCIFGSGSAFHHSAVIQNGSNRRENIVIGCGSYVCGYLTVCASCGVIRIGDNSFIGENTRIYSALSVDIGDRVQIAHDCNIFDNNIHSLVATERHFEYVQNLSKGWDKLYDLHEKPVVICDDVWLGASVIILKGVRIGKGVIVGAGSVVVDDIPDYSLAVGNPAKVIKRLL